MGSGVEPAGASAVPTSKTVSVVIPAKNEAANLPWVLGRMPAWVHEVIVVDGLSTDGTIEVARACWPDVVVVHERRPGKGAAVRAGFEAATGDIVAMLDGDGSMDPQELDVFVQAIDRGAGLAKGSRRIAGGGSADLTWIRDLGNLGLLAVSNLLLRTRFSELCYGYMALRRDVVPHLGLKSDGFEIETEIVTRAVRCGVPVHEVPSFEYPRRAGTSNLNAIRDGFRIASTLVKVCFSPRRVQLSPPSETWESSAPRATAGPGAAGQGPRGTTKVGGSATRLSRIR